MRKWGKGNSPQQHASHEKPMDDEFGDLQDVLQAVRDSHYAASERPDHYWKYRHDAIMNKLDTPTPAPVSKFQLAYLWIPAAAVVLLFLFSPAENSNARVPDIAAGYDQDLLIEVERALSRTYPLALKPAALLAQEIEQGVVRK